VCYLLWWRRGPGAACVHLRRHTVGDRPWGLRRWPCPFGLLSALPFDARMAGVGWSGYLSEFGCLVRREVQLAKVAGIGWPGYVSEFGCPVR
jgi:hypothetical protein